MSETQKRSSIPILVIILVVLVILGIVFQDRLNEDSDTALADLSGEVSRSMADIYAKAAADAEQQYYIALRSGSAMDACVHAGVVAAAHLQATNESKYTLWKQTEKRACAAAGLPEMP